MRNLQPAEAYSKVNEVPSVTSCDHEGGEMPLCREEDRIEVIPRFCLCNIGLYALA
jgi:hypothetical protein